MWSLRNKGLLSSGADGCLGNPDSAECPQGKCYFCVLNACTHLPSDSQAHCRQALPWIPGKTKGVALALASAAEVKRISKKGKESQNESTCWRSYLHSRNFPASGCPKHTTAEVHRDIKDGARQKTKQNKQKTTDDPNSSKREAALLRYETVLRVDKNPESESGSLLSFANSGRWWQLPADWPVADQISGARSAPRSSSHPVSQWRVHLDKSPYGKVAVHSPSTHPTARLGKRGQLLWCRPHSEFLLGLQLHVSIFIRRAMVHQELMSPTLKIKITWQ